MTWFVQLGDLRQKTSPDFQFLLKVSDFRVQMLNRMLQEMNLEDFSNTTVVPPDHQVLQYSVEFPPFPRQDT